MADKNSRLLSEELKNEIIRLARMGYSQLKIMKMLDVSQYAVTRYSKGINPPKHIGAEQKSEVIMLLQETSYPAKKIAEIVGVSARCVTRINHTLQIRPSRKSRTLRQVPKRDKSLRYDVLVFNWVGHPRVESAITFDHVPCYWDLIKVCKAVGMEADDFETENGSNVRSKVSYGNVYDESGATIAKYYIERVVGDESDYDEFWDGMDKNFYDN